MYVNALSSDATRLSMRSCVRFTAKQSVSQRTGIITIPSTTPTDASSRRENSTQDEQLGERRCGRGGVRGGGGDTRDVQQNN